MLNKDVSEARGDEEQDEDVHDRQATADVLTDPSSNSASSTAGPFSMPNRNSNYLPNSRDSTLED